MTRRTVLTGLGLALWGTYVWQIAEALLAGEGVRVIHVLGIALAAAFTAVHAFTAK